MLTADTGSVRYAANKCPFIIKMSVSVPPILQINVAMWALGDFKVELLAQFMVHLDIQQKADSSGANATHAVMP